MQHLPRARGESGSGRTWVGYMYGITEPPLSGGSARGSRALSTPWHPTLGLPYRTCTSTTARFRDTSAVRSASIMTEHTPPTLDSTGPRTARGAGLLGAVERGLPRPGQLCVVGAYSTSQSLPTIGHNRTCSVPALRRVVHLQHAEKGPLVVHLGTSASPVRARAAVRAHTPNMGAHYAYAELHLPLSLVLIQPSCGGDGGRGCAGRG
jgi:hypothetical protein